MTVSRVLNSEPNVRPATKARVLDAVQALNYKPNISARSLAKARTYFIGLLYDNPNVGYLSEMLVGALERCRKEGYHLVLETCGSSEASWSRNVADILATSSFDGVIIPPPVCDYPDVIAAVREAGLPYVRIAPDRDVDQSSYVRTDDFEAAKRMTHYLLDLGHERIGFIKGHPDHAATHQRYDGFVAALEGRDAGLIEDFVTQGMFTYKSGLACAEALLSGRERPSAIFASNDDMAAAVIAIAHKYDLDVPVDLTVVGFDDTQTARTIWPQLTTVRQPISAMAGAAVELLARNFDAIEDDGTREFQDLECEIIVRDSSASPLPASG